MIPFLSHFKSAPSRHCSLSLCICPFHLFPTQGNHVSTSHESPLTALASRVARFAHIDARRAGRGVILGGVDDALLDVRGQVVKGLVNVDVALSRDLEEWDAQLLGQSLALLSRDGALLLPVALVAYQDLVDALGGVLLYVCEPGADICSELPLALSLISFYFFSPAPGE